MSDEKLHIMPSDGIGIVGWMTEDREIIFRFRHDGAFKN
jgi:hypothetical protein